MMQQLKPREQVVLQLRYGLGGKECHSLSQVSEVLDVSKERIRQIQEAALEKLRSLARDLVHCDVDPVTHGPIHRSNRGPIGRCEPIAGPDRPACFGISRLQKGDLTPSRIRFVRFRCREGKRGRLNLPSQVFPWPPSPPGIPPEPSARVRLPPPDHYALLVAAGNQRGQIAGDRIARRRAGQAAAE